MEDNISVYPKISADIFGNLFLEEEIQRFRGFLLESTGPVVVHLICLDLIRLATHQSQELDTLMNLLTSGRCKVEIIDCLGYDSIPLSAKPAVLRAYKALLTVATKDIRLGTRQLSTMTHDECKETLFTLQSNEHFHDLHLDLYTTSDTAIEHGVTRVLDWIIESKFRGSFTYHAAPYDSIVWDLFIHLLDKSALRMIGIQTVRDGFDSDQSEAVQRALQSNTTVGRLELFLYNDDCLKPIYAGLTKNSSITHLDVPGETDLELYLPKMKAVRVLDVLCPESREAFVSALRWNTSVVELNGRTGTKTEGPIGRYLKRNSLLSKAERALPLLSRPNDMEQPGSLPSLLLSCFDATDMEVSSSGMFVLIRGFFPQYCKTETL